MSTSSAWAQDETLIVNKAYADSEIIASEPTELIITLFNTDTNNAQTNVSLVDIFPDGLEIDSVVSNSCGGTLTTSTGADPQSVTLVNGTIPAAPSTGPSSCEIVVRVTASDSGSYTNTIDAGDVTGVAGGQPTTNGTGTSATLTIEETLPLTVRKSFAASTIGQGGESFFTVTINNPNNIALGDVSFSDTLPPELQFATDPGSGTTIRSNTCGANAVPPAAGSGSTTQTGLTVPATGSCAIQFAFIGTVAGGPYTNEIPAGNVTSAQLGPDGTNVAGSSANVSVQSEFEISKDYSANAVTIGQTINVTIRLFNPSPAPIENVAFTDNLPESGNGIPDLLVAPPGVVSNSCGGTVTATPGAAQFSLSGGTVPGANTSTGAPGACAIVVRLEGNDSQTPSINTIPIGDVGGTQGGNPVTNSNPGEDSITVGSPGDTFPVGVEKAYSLDGTSFSRTGIQAPAGSVLRGRILITNPQNAGIRDVVADDEFFPTTVDGSTSDIVLASPANVEFQNCGEDPTLFTAANGFPSGPSTPNLTPLPGGNGFQVTGISLLPLTGTAAGSTSGGVNPACFIFFDVQGSVSGQHRNILAQNDVAGGTVPTRPAIIGVSGDSASSLFTYVSPLDVAKLYTPDIITANTGISTLRITLTNSNATAPITDVAFTDLLPAAGTGETNLIAANPNINNSCGGTVTAVAGGNELSLSGGTIPAAVAGVNGTCVVEVDTVLNDPNDGNSSLRNFIQIGDVTGRINVGGAVTDVINLLRREDTINARVLDISVEKSFSPGTIDGGDTSDVTITLINPNPNNFDIFDVALTDALPNGMIVADPAVSSTTCTADGTTAGTPATITANPGSSDFTVSGFTLFAGTLAAGEQDSCSVTVRVTTLQTGSIVNTIPANAVTSRNGATNGSPFSATLTVLPNTAVSKEFIDDTIQVGEVTELEIRILNANGAPATNISVTDVMPPEVLVAPGPVINTAVGGTTCPGLNVDAPSGGNTITASGLTLPAFSECRFQVEVTSNIPSDATGYVNTILPTQVNSNEGGIRTVDATDNLVVVNAPIVDKSFDLTEVPLGETVRLTARVSNPDTSAGGDPLTNVNFVDILPTAPGNMLVATTPNFVSSAGCSSGTFAGNVADSTQISWSGGTLNPNQFCEFSIDVIADAVGDYTNELPACDLTNPNPVAGTDAAATATAGGTNSCNIAGVDASVTVSDLELSFVKVLSAEDGAEDGVAEAGETLTYEIQITNASDTATASDVAVVDIVPENTTFVSADNGGALNSDQVEWTVDVPPEGITLTVAFQVVDPIPDGVTSIDNNVTVDGEACATLPCVSTPVQAAALTISKVLTGENGSADGVAEAGEELTYTITVENTTGTNAADALIVDIVPENTTFVSASDGGALNGAQVEWTADVAGNETITRTITVVVDNPLEASVTEIVNNATVNDTPCGTDPCVTTPVQGPELSITKALTAENGAAAGFAEAGEELTYTITVSNGTGTNAADALVADIIPANTTFVSASDGGVLNGSGTQAEWTVDVPANGSVTRTLTVRVADVIPAGTLSIDNSATINGIECDTLPCVSTPVQEPELSISKALTGENGAVANSAEAGEELTYTITVANGSGTSAADALVVDVIPENTEFVSASDGGILNGGQVEWTVDVAANDNITRTLTVRVVDPIPAGVTEIVNNATVNGEGCMTAPCVTTPVEPLTLEIEKALTGENGPTPGFAEEGEELTYTITVRNTSGINAAAALISDPVPANTSFVSASDGGVLNGNVVTWTTDITANTEITRTVTFRVDDVVPLNVETIANSATVNDEVCTAQPCVETPVGRPQLTFDKILAAESGTFANIVEPGEQLTYEIAIENSGTANAVSVDVIDTLDQVVTFVSASNGGVLNANQVEWTIDVPVGETVTLTVVTEAPTPLPAGIQQVINDATVNGEVCDSTPCVITPAAQPPIAVDDDGGENQVGLAVTLDTPGNDIATTAPLDVTSVQIVGTDAALQPLTVAGEGVWSVDPATGQITFTPEPGFADDPTPINYTIRDTLGQVSNEAVETLEYTDDLLVRLTKTASVRTVRIGDQVLYTLTLENIGNIDLVDATIFDTPPQGFVLVAGSLTVADADGAGTLSAQNPIQIDNIDIAAGETATISYLVAVGAGTLPGTHINTAITLSNEVPISNEATAVVESGGDPLLDETLLLGTVFEDRDGDAWQDPADATDIVITGGIDESVYVANSTTIDFGDGPQPLADASAPLNHGVGIKQIAGRRSVAQPASANQVVISMLLTEPRFAEGLELKTDEGTRLQMAANGSVTANHTGSVEDSLNGQDINIERRITPEGDKYRVDYIVTNQGVNERGIAGVRIGTVEGLIVETDAYGRFFLIGVSPQRIARGSNFIMKVDTATLPKGSVMTTENPRIRRITPGVPVRFDFGVQFPETVIEGSSQAVTMELGEFVFDANSAVLKPEYAPVIGRMAAEVRNYGGGNITIDGRGGTPELALARAQAVHQALKNSLSPELLAQTNIRVTGEEDGPEVLTYGQRMIIGEVFFDTDKTAIRPEYEATIARIAEAVASGEVRSMIVTGHADLRGSDAYNVDLGKRRAQSVFDAITARLSPAQRDAFKVRYLPPSTPASPLETRPIESGGEE
ncbi:MAG: OmpA family protein [Pseudomonadota bacterium]